MARSRKTRGAWDARPSYADELREAIGLLLTAPVGAGLPDIGTRWTAGMLLAAAVLMVFEKSEALADRLDALRPVLAALFPHRKRCGRSYTGYSRALVRHGPRLLAFAAAALRHLVRQAAAGHWAIEGWAVFGIDGSRFDAPRTAANLAAFGTGGKKKGGPRLSLSTVLHLPTGLPWAAKVGKAASDERSHLRQMLPLLPEQALIVADAGYPGYGVMEAILASGRHFLLRVGSTTRLLTGLGYDVREREGIVYLWPAGVRQAGAAPLVLRLIRLHDGRKEVCLISDVPDEARLSDALAARLYRLRWGLELHYRAMKQTLRRRELRSKAPARAALELRFAAVGMALLSVLAVRRLIESGREPLALSPANALRALRRALKEADKRPRRGQRLAAAWSAAVRDHYRRQAAKASKGYPRKKREKPPGPPRVRQATTEEVRAAQALRARRPAA